LFPNPSPFEAPFTNPAISTKEITALIIFFDCEIFEIIFSLSSGTRTLPMLGSIVQNGKLAAVLFLIELKH
tara:strand:- start:18 stop:230 length:213 start_codon:yes stop_codon:yes gene_type:complete